MSAIKDLVSQLKTAVADADETTRRTLADELRQIAISLETPNDSIVRIIHTPLELMGAQIGMDLGLFHILVEAEKPMTVQDIVAKTGGDPVLIARLCRLMNSYHLIGETAQDTFVATSVTKTLTHPGYEGSIAHHFHSINKCFQVLPNFLKDAGYKNPSDPTKCAFNVAWDFPGPAFAFFETHPWELGNFIKHMSSYHEGKKEWTTAVPFSDHLSGWTGEKAVWVDVGGGTGEQSVAFKRAAPDASGRVVLEDLPQMLDRAPELPGIEKTHADFFQPQPVKGAKFYYMRNILHDWPDEKAVAILKNQIDAMEPHSVLLINEIVVPNQDAHAQATQMDIVMMSGLASMERTKDQWYELLEKKAGLKITKLTTYGLFMGDSIIECKPVKFIN